MTLLAATIHDPDGRLRRALEERGGHLAQYAGVAVAVTPETDGRLADRLRERGATVVAGSEAIGTSRRAALRAAAVIGGDVLYCDFDRWLHWAGRFPDELAAVPGRLERRRPRPWYACLGRTARAFASHPPVQQAAERATNRALSFYAGRRLDAVAGACWLSPAGVEVILRGSIEATNATDLEWPALILRAEPARLAALACEGLEFETATFAGDEIEAAGGEAAWLRRRYDRPEVWRDRLRLAVDSVAAACRVLGDGGGGAPAAARIARQSGEARGSAAAAEAEGRGSSTGLG